MTNDGEEKIDASHGLGYESPPLVVNDIDDFEDIVPAVGMVFDSSLAIFEMYKKYGQLHGFPVKRRTSNKDKDGMCKFVTFTCARGGKLITRSKNVRSLRPSQKNGCFARIRARALLVGNWEITSFDDQHNHPLSPSKSRFFICNREINAHVQRQLIINDIAGIRPNKSHSAQVIAAGGHENLCFLQKDTRNLIAKARRMRMGEGDAAAIQGYFAKMQSQNDGFFSLIDWDEEGRLKSVFWADPRSRAAAREFGDVVTFDTTYLTNKYDMPFAPFVGVNHHGQSILLGCGLVANENTDTFTWLFTTWLTCMHGVAPKGIITDQDRAMHNAISVVFPNSWHRWCLWHILKKIPEKLGSFKEYNSIIVALGNAIFDSHSIGQFESEWNSMVATFRLEGNTWLDSLYLDREMWVPIYVKNFFWAGMSTTQRSESINAFFDGYVHSKTTLKQFVEQHNNALRDKAEKESLADFNSANKQLQCVTSFAMEIQIQKLYTESKFKEFQSELCGMVYCGILSVECIGDFKVFNVEEDISHGDNCRKKVVFKVLWDERTLSVQCVCCRFEFRGMVCRHSIIVLVRMSQCLLPPQYIFDRWRKDLRRCHSRVKINYEGWTVTTEQHRYDELCNFFANVADLAAMSEAKYRSLKNLLVNEANKMEAHHLVDRVAMGSNQKDPVVVRSKGRLDV